MLLEVYILFQILAIIGLIMIFHSTTILVSAVTMVLSGILMIGAWVLNLGTNFIWDPSIRAYATEIVTINTPYLASFNILIFSLALMYFFSDLFDLLRGETSKMERKENNEQPQ